MTLKPEPKTVKVECSLCGLPWEEHGKDPSAETCIDLLKRALAAAKAKAQPAPAIPWQPNPGSGYRPNSPIWETAPYQPNVWSGGFTSTDSTKYVLINSGEGNEGFIPTTGEQVAKVAKALRDYAKTGKAAA